MQQWLTKKNTCPSCVAVYRESRCAPLVINFLSKLKISCLNEENGCKDPLPYDFIEKHQRDCEYIKIACRGCDLLLLKKDHNEHEANCEHIEMLCEMCEMNIKRKDEPNHKGLPCAQNKIKSLEKKLTDLESKHEQNERGLKDKLSKTQMQLEEAIMKNDELSTTKQSLMLRVKELETENLRFKLEGSGFMGGEYNHKPYTSKCLRCNNTGKLEKLVQLKEGVIQQQIIACTECNNDKPSTLPSKPRVPTANSTSNTNDNKPNPNLGKFKTGGKPGFNSFVNRNEDDSLPEKGENCAQQ
jgi:hypothetical protein